MKNYELNSGKLTKKRVVVANLKDNSSFPET